MVDGDLETADPKKAKDAPPADAVTDQDETPAEETGEAGDKSDGKARPGDPIEKARTEVEDAQRDGYKYNGEVQLPMERVAQRERAAFRDQCAAMVEDLKADLKKASNTARDLNIALRDGLKPDSAEYKAREQQVRDAYLKTAFGRQNALMYELDDNGQRQAVWAKDVDGNPYKTDQFKPSKLQVQMRVELARLEKEAELLTQLEKDGKPVPKELVTQLGLASNNAQEALNGNVKARTAIDDGLRGCGYIEANYGLSEVRRTKYLGGEQKLALLSDANIHLLRAGHEDPKMMNPPDDNYLKNLQKVLISAGMSEVEFKAVAARAPLKEEKRPDAQPVRKDPPEVADDAADRKGAPLEPPLRVPPEVSLKPVKEPTADKGDAGESKPDCAEPRSLGVAEVVTDEDNCAEDGDSPKVAESPEDVLQRFATSSPAADLMGNCRKMLEQSKDKTQAMNSAALEPGVSLRKSFEKAIELADAEFTQIEAAVKTRNADLQRAIDDVYTPEKKKEADVLQASLNNQTDAMEAKDKELLAEFKKSGIGDERRAEINKILTENYPRIAKTSNDIMAILGPVMPLQQELLQNTRTLEQAEERQFFSRVQYADALNQIADKANAQVQLEKALTFVPEAARSKILEAPPVKQLVESIGMTKKDDPTEVLRDPGDLMKAALYEMKNGGGIETAKPYFEEAIRNAEKLFPPEVMKADAKLYAEALQKNQFQGKQLDKDDRLVIHQLFDKEVLERCLVACLIRSCYAASLQESKQYKDAARVLQENVAKAKDLPLAEMRIVKDEAALDLAATKETDLKATNLLRELTEKIGGPTNQEGYERFGVIACKELARFYLSARSSKEKPVVTAEVDPEKLLDVDLKEMESVDYFDPTKAMDACLEAKKCIQDLYPEIDLDKKENGAREPELRRLAAEAARLMPEHLKAQYQERSAFLRNLIPDGGAGIVGTVVATAASLAILHRADLAAKELGTEAKLFLANSKGAGQAELTLAGKAVVGTTGLGASTATRAVYARLSTGEWEPLQTSLVHGGGAYAAVSVFHLRNTILSNIKSGGVASRLEAEGVITVQELSQALESARVVPDQVKGLMDLVKVSPNMTIKEAVAAGKLTLAGAEGANIVTKLSKGFTEEAAVLERLAGKGVTTVKHLRELVNGKFGRGSFHRTFPELTNFADDVLLTTAAESSILFGKNGSAAYKVLDKLAPAAEVEFLTRLDSQNIRTIGELREAINGCSKLNKKTWEEAFGFLGKQADDTLLLSELSKNEAIFGAKGSDAMKALNRLAPAENTVLLERLSMKNIGTVAELKNAVVGADGLGQSAWDSVFKQVAAKGENVSVAECLNLIRTNSKAMKALEKIAPAQELEILQRMDAKSIVDIANLKQAIVAHPNFGQAVWDKTFAEIAKKGEVELLTDMWKAGSPFTAEQWKILEQLAPNTERSMISGFVRDVLPWGSADIATATSRELGARRTWGGYLTTLGSLAVYENSVNLYDKAYLGAVNPKTNEQFTTFDVLYDTNLGGESIFLRALMLAPFCRPGNMHVKPYVEGAGLFEKTLGYTVTHQIKASERIGRLMFGSKSSGLNFAVGATIVDQGHDALKGVKGLSKTNKIKSLYDQIIEHQEQGPENVPAFAPNGTAPGVEDLGRKEAEVKSPPNTPAAGAAKPKVLSDSNPYADKPNP